MISEERVNCFRCDNPAATQIVNTKPFYGYTYCLDCGFSTEYADRARMTLDETNELREQIAIQPIGEEEFNNNWSKGD